jgi:NAD+ synthase (glutamine-hydrolysing)
MMIQNGFFRVAAAVPEVKVADCGFNTQQIKKLTFEAFQEQIEIICFPELSLTAYSCADLFFQQTLINETEKELQGLLSETAGIPVCFIVGAPVRYLSKLYNCAIVCNGGKIYGIVPKAFLPNSSGLSEKRWFEPYPLDNPTITIDYAGEAVPFGTNLLFDYQSVRFAVEIGEDLWSVIPPSSNHAIAGAQVIFNPSAGSELTGKQRYVKSLISQQSARCHTAYVYASAGFGESTTDMVYAGNAFIYENGHLLAESERFQFNRQLIVSEIDLDLLNAERGRNTIFNDQPLGSDYKQIDISPDNDTNRKPIVLSRKINPLPFIPFADYYYESCEEIFSIQVAGLAKRLLHTGAKSLLVGVSGGLDSTLALLVCVKTTDKLELPRSIVCGVTMPGFGTTNRTYTNAIRLMQSLGITIKEIPIGEACEQHFKDIGHDSSIHDITYENTQARERTQILMDLANRQNGLVIGTGDMSELALGWATYNGDHMSMYGVNAGIPKTLVRHLVKWVAETQMDESCRTTLEDILHTPFSPELLPVDSQGQTIQFTEDLVGPYELHDFFLFYTVRYGFTPTKIYFLAQQAFRNTYDEPTILKWMSTFFRRFFSQQFKRSCMPDGPKVGSVNLSPRGDWRMPSDACANLWLKEIEAL